MSHCYPQNALNGNNHPVYVQEVGQTHCMEAVLMIVLLNIMLDHANITKGGIWH